MLRRAVCSIVCLAAVGYAQSAPQRFDAASIRPSNSEELNTPSGILTTPGLARAINVTLKRAIAGAYGIGESRILGGPEWIDSDRFQITAKTNRPLDDAALMIMLQTLLAERFNLKLHRENRTGEGLLLEIAKNGLKLRAETDARTSYNNGHGRLDATAVSMRTLAEILSRNTAVPVVDRTGLSGAFDFTLSWDPDAPRTLEPDDAAAFLREVLANAIQQQLGLTLKSQRMPMEVLIVDGAQKPSEN